MTNIETGKKTIILYCSCHSSWQDKEYGNNRRVMNVTQKDNIARCSVCGQERSIK